MKIRLNNKIIRTLTLAFLFGLAFLPSAVLADEPTWGPERDTYTMQAPADYAVFNSITNNPTLEDERKFVRVAQIPSDCIQSKIDYSEPIDGQNAPTPVANDTECVLDFKQSVEVEPGEQYMVYIYYHNNAGTDRNGSTYGRRGIAKNVTMFSDYPDLILGQRGEISAEIKYTKMHKNADDTWSWDDKQSSVWAKAYLTNSDNDQIALSYVTGSAKHYNVGRAGDSGKILPLTGSHASEPKIVADKNVTDELFTDQGALLGFYDGITESGDTGSFGSGDVYGCEPFHGIVTYVLQAAEYRGEVDKQVSIDNGTTYKESVTVEPGAEVTFRVAVNNVGQAELTHVILDDILPTGLTLVPGSVELSKKGSTTWDKQNDSDEYNLGTVGSGQTVYIRYKAKTGNNFDCIGKTLKNTAKITYDGVTSAGITDEDQATVVVRKTGDECTDLTKATIEKEASINNGKTYKEAVEILPGETATFKVTIKNVGNMNLGHIDFEDTLPNGLTLVEGSIKLTKYDEDGNAVSGSDLTGLKARIEVLAPGTSVEITYKAQAGKDFDCKGKELTNTAKISYKSSASDNDGETSSAKVRVKKSGEECEEPEPTCKTNPEMEGCEEMPDTGPFEIAMVSMIVCGITGGTIYLILAKRSLKKMTASVMDADSLGNQDKNDGMGGMPNDGRQ